jgi:general secretion pathway protein D
MDAAARKLLTLARAGAVLALTYGVAWAQPPTPPPSGPLLRTPAGQRVRSGPVRMNYENLDIRVLAKLVSELSGRNILLDDRVQGRVTLLSNRDMSGAEVYDVFRAALERYGYIIKPMRGYDLVVPVADARRLAVLRRPGQGRGGNEPVLGMILLKNADVGQMQAVLKPLVSDPNLLNAYPNARAILVVERPAVISRIAELARQMDRATPTTRVEVLRLRYADAERLAPVVQQVMTRSQSALGDAPAPRVGAFAPANSLVVQGTSEQIATAQRLVQRLDVPRAAPDEIEKPQFFVHFLQYAKAEDTAKVLAALLGESQEAQRREQALDQGNLQNAGANQGQAYPRFNDSALGNTTTTGSAGVSGASEGGDQNQRIAFISSKVAHDAETNSLVLFMSPSEYTKIDDLLDEIDVPRKQVLMLGMVAEVSLSKVMQRGARLQIASPQGLLAGFRGGLTEEGLLSTLASGQFTLGTLGGGVTQTINVGGRDVKVPAFFSFLTASTNTTDFNLISSPRILTSDHKEGIVEVGDVVPFATGARFDNFGQPLVTYDYKKVGITLNFTPHVSQSDQIRIDLNQEVQEVTDFLEQNLGGFGYVIPLISNRSLKTTVTLKEGETLLIGGLISKRTLDVVSKVPILGDIPLINNFFKETNKEERKTTLFIALTPYVINHPDEVARLDRPYEEFLKEEGSPRDAQHETRPPARKHPVEEPYGPMAKSMPPEGSLILEDLRVVEPKSGDSLRQARIKMRNRNPFEVEVVLRQQVRSPEGQATEARSEPQRLKPGEEREVVLPPYRFPSKGGDYLFDVSAWVGEQQVSRLPLPRKVHLEEQP